MMNLNTSNPAPLTPNIALIGAGAVITKDVPDHALMVGNPARQIGWMCVCGTTLRQARGNGQEAMGKTSSDPLVCGYCGNEYRIDGDNLGAVKK